MVAKVGFKMFLGVSATVSWVSCRGGRGSALAIPCTVLNMLRRSVQVTGWSNEDSEFSLLLDDNPLLDFVELPEELRSLKSVFDPDTCV